MIIIETIIVGILTVVFGSLIGYIIGYLFKTDLPKVCKNWNKFYVMELSLFLTGMLIHIFCEYVGINKWYCKNGYACKK